MIKNEDTVYLPWNFLIKFHFVSVTIQFNITAIKTIYSTPSTFISSSTFSFFNKTTHTTNNNHWQHQKSHPPPLHILAPAGKLALTARDSVTRLTRKFPTDVASSAQRVLLQNLSKIKLNQDFLRFANDTLFSGGESRKLIWDQFESMSSANSNIMGKSVENWKPQLQPIKRAVAGTEFPEIVNCFGGMQPGRAAFRLHRYLGPPPAANAIRIIRGS